MLHEDTYAALQQTPLFANLYHPSLQSSTLNYPIEAPHLMADKKSFSELHPNLTSILLKACYFEQAP